MSVIDTLVTDRVAADVDRFAALAAKRWQDMTEDERAEFIKGRGIYTAVDMNRVGEAINYLVARLNANGGRIRLIEGKTDYSVGANITPAMAVEYLKTIEAAREMFYTYTSTPKVPDSLENFSYVSANDIERILKDVDELITKSQMALAYSGDIYAGEV